MISARAGYGQIKRCAASLTVIFTLLTSIGPPTVNARLVVQLGHTAVVNCAAFSPHYDFLATCSNDDTIKLWDRSTGMLLRTLTSPDNDIKCVAFSPDGKTLASVAADCTLKLWDVAHGWLLKSVKEDASPTGLSFSPDGKLLAFDGVGGLDVCSSASGAIEHTIPDSYMSVSSVSFDASDRILATGAWDGSITLWRIADGHRLRSIQSGPDIVQLVALSPDGKTVAGLTIQSATQYSVVKLFDVETGRLIGKIVGANDAYSTLAFRHDGKVLAVGGVGGKVVLWNLPNRHLRALGNGFTSGASFLVFSPDDTELVGAEIDNSVQLYSLTTGRIVQSFSGHNFLQSSAKFNPSGQTFAYCGMGTGRSQSDRVRVSSLYDGRIAQTLGRLVNSSGPFAFSHDGRTLVCSSDTVNPQIWDLNRNRPLATLAGNSAQVNGYAFNADSTLLAAASWDGTARVWELRTDKLVRSLATPSQLSSVAFSPRGSILATMSVDGVAEIWDIADGRLLQTLHNVSNLGLDDSATFSPDGKMLAAAADNITLWDVSTGESLRSFACQPGDCFVSAAFSPDGSLLAGASNDHTINIWHVADGSVCGSLTSSGTSVRSVTFSPDGKTVLSANADGSFVFWKYGAGTKLSVYSFDNGGWLCVSPLGLYDGNGIGLRQLHWVQNNTPSPLPQRFEGLTRDLLGSFLDSGCPRVESTRLLLAGRRFRRHHRWGAGRRVLNRRVWTT